MLGITFQWFVSVKRNKEIVQYSLHMDLTYSFSTFTGAYLQIFKLNFGTAIKMSWTGF